MSRYALSSFPLMGDQEPPFAVLTTDDTGTLVKIEAYPGVDSEGAQDAERLSMILENEPGSLTLNRLAVSYGAVKEMP